MSPTLRTHAGFAVFVLISAAVFFPFLQQFVLLSLGGWFTLGFVILVMVARRDLVARFPRVRILEGNTNSLGPSAGARIA